MHGCSLLRSNLSKFGKNAKELRTAAHPVHTTNEDGNDRKNEEEGGTIRKQIVLDLEMLALSLCPEIQLMADSYESSKASNNNGVEDLHKHNFGLLPLNKKGSLRHNAKKAALILSFSLELSRSTDNGYHRLLILSACAAFLDGRGGYAFQVLKQLDTAPSSISEISKRAIAQQWESNRISVSRLTGKDDANDEEMLTVLSKGKNVTVDTISGYRLPANRSPESPLKNAVTMQAARDEWERHSSSVKKRGKNHELAIDWCAFFEDIHLDENALNIVLAIVDEKEVFRMGSWNIRAYDKVFHKIKKCLPSKMAALAHVVNQQHWSAFALQECPSHVEFDKQLRDEFYHHPVFLNWDLLTIDLGSERCGIGFDKEEWEVITSKETDRIIIMHAFNTISSVFQFRRLPALSFLRHKKNQPSSNVIALVSVHLKSVSSKEDASQTRAEIEFLGSHLTTYVAEVAKRLEITEAYSTLLVGDFNLSPPTSGLLETAGVWKGLIESGFTMALSSDIKTNVFEYNAAGNSTNTNDKALEYEEEEGQAYDNAWFSSKTSSLIVSGEVFDLVSNERKESLARVEAALDCERSGLSELERETSLRYIRRGLQADFFTSFSDHKPITIILSRKIDDDDDGIALPVERRLDM
jgi:hypothetical protein